MQSESEVDYSGMRSDMAMRKQQRELSRKNGERAEAICGYIKGVIFCLSFKVGVF